MNVTLVLKVLGNEARKLAFHAYCYERYGIYTAAGSKASRERRELLEAMDEIRKCYSGSNGSLSPASILAATKSIDCAT